MRKQNAHLFTLEVAFGNQDFKISDAFQIRSDSVMWLKERLVNHAMSVLDLDAFAWIDADLMFLDDCWIDKAKDLLCKFDVLQLFKRVFYLPQGHKSYQGVCERSFDGIVHQRNLYSNWLDRRKNLELPFAAPGFAWAARREALKLYDRDIVGSGDCILADALLNSWDLHGFHTKYSDGMKQDIKSWASEIKGLKVGCLPVDVLHLWHGDIRNRGYMKRHSILTNHDYSPSDDITLNGPVFEWSSNKPGLHNDLVEYFCTRQD